MICRITGNWYSMSPTKNQKHGLSVQVNAVVHILCKVHIHYINISWVNFTLISLKSDGEITPFYQCSETSKTRHCQCLWMQMSHIFRVNDKEGSMTKTTTSRALNTSGVRLLHNHFGSASFLKKEISRFDKNVNLGLLLRHKKAAQVYINQFSLILFFCFQTTC